MTQTVTRKILNLISLSSKKNKFKKLKSILMYHLGWDHNRKTNTCRINWECLGKYMVQFAKFNHLWTRTLCFQGNHGEKKKITIVFSKGVHGYLGTHGLSYKSGTTSHFYKIWNSTDRQFIWWECRYDKVWKGVE